MGGEYEVESHSGYSYSCGTRDEQKGGGLISFFLSFIG